MRVGIDVHVLNGPSQGTASVWLNLLPHLPPMHEYWLYSFDPALTKRLVSDKRFIHRRIGVHQPLVRIQLVYPWLARRDRCDVFHVNYYGPWLGTPGLVVTVQDVIYLDFPQFAPSLRRKQMELLGRVSVHAARCVTTGSRYSKDRITARFGIPDDKVAVVPNGLGPEWTNHDRQAVAAAWRALASRLPKRYMLTVGRLDPRKNFPLAARVTKALQRMDFVDGLVIVGPEDFGGPSIRDAWQREGTSHLVVHLSGVELIPLQALYANAQCLLFLSLAEGFGMPLLEAMAMGTPIVASNRTAIPEICGDAALVVDPDDEEAVVEAAWRLLTDDSLRLELISRGRRRVDEFDAERAALQMVEAYRAAAQD